MRQSVWVVHATVALERARRTGMPGELPWLSGGAGLDARKPPFVTFRSWPQAVSDSVTLTRLCLASSGCAPVLESSLLDAAVERLAERCWASPA
jgi:hypothetical protein